MKVNGLITIFPKMRGKYKFFDGTISQKTEDDKFINCSIECKFGNKELFDEDYIDGLEVGKYYQVKVLDGFLSVDEWEDKDTNDTRKKLVLIIQECRILSSGILDKKKSKSKI